MWQRDVAIAHYKIADALIVAKNADDGARRIPTVIAIMTKLKNQNQLAPGQEDLLTDAQAALANPSAK
jgi:hypothetical protein